MKILPEDFKKLRLSVFVSLLMLGIGSTVFFLANTAHLSASNALNVARKEHREISEKLRILNSEAGILQERIAKFRQLEQYRILGEEQRLEWIELFKAIRERQQVIDLRYEISPQRPVDSTSGFKFSPIKFHLELLHEEDLIRFIDDLRTQARAMIRIRYCKLTRTVHGKEYPGTARVGTNLLADCEMDWITLNLADKNTGGK